MQYSISDIYILVTGRSGEIKYIENNVLWKSENLNLWVDYWCFLNTGKGEKASGRKRVKIVTTRGGAEVLSREKMWTRWVSGISAKKLTQIFDPNILVLKFVCWYIISFDHLCIKVFDIQCSGRKDPYLIFVADAADIVRGEFYCHVEKFLMWRHFRWWEILDVEKFYMWRHFGRGEICLISWVVSSGIPSQVNW